MMISFGSFLNRSRDREQALPGTIYIGDVTRELAESGDWVGITVGPVLDSQGSRIPGRGTVSAISRIRLK